DAEGYNARGGDDSEEIAKAAPGDRDVRIEGVGVNDRGDGVGGVVEAVNEFEGESDKKGDPQQEIGQKGTGSHFCEVVDYIPSNVDNSADGDQCKDKRADHAGAFGEFFVNGGCCRWRGGRGRRRCCDGGHERLLRSVDLCGDAGAGSYTGGVV